MFRNERAEEFFSAILFITIESTLCELSIIGKTLSCFSVTRSFYEHSMQRKYATKATHGASKGRRIFSTRLEEHNMHTHIRGNNR